MRMLLKLNGGNIIYIYIHVHVYTINIYIHIYTYYKYIGTYVLLDVQAAGTEPKKKKLGP